MEPCKSRLRLRPIAFFAPAEISVLCWPCQVEEVTLLCRHWYLDADAGSRLLEKVHRS